MPDDADVTDRLQAMSTHDPAGFQVAALPEKYRAIMFRGIRAFRLTSTRMEARKKMSQDRTVADRQGVVAGLRVHGGADELRVAALIEAGLAQ